MLDGLLTDLRVAIRSLLRDRSVATTAIVTLGLAMSIGVAVIVVVNAYLFKALPYPGATRLYSVRYAPPGEPAPGGMQKLDWTALDDVIEHPIAWDLDVFYLIGGGTQAEAAPGAWVTPGFVEGLGIRPAVGRGFDRAAFVPNSPQVTLISHRLWQTRFGGDPDIVGREFNAYVSDRPEEAETFVIIGVLPADFWHVNTYTEILAPLRVPTYPYMVRLREGVTPGAASDRISALVRAGSPGLAPDWKVDLVSTHDAYVSR
ncbi:MAG TPA: ABC transporter permease, partial [Vicinamibacterales bacterium]|nr:ABC transporter permease [Vicinamibacterales bacterium]